MDFSTLHFLQQIANSLQGVKQDLWDLEASSCVEPAVGKTKNQAKLSSKELHSAPGGEGADPGAEAITHFSVTHPSDNFIFLHCFLWSFFEAAKLLALIKATFSDTPHVLQLLMQSPGESTSGSRD